MTEFQTYPPSSGFHKDCDLYEEHYHTEESQQEQKDRSSYSEKCHDDQAKKLLSDSLILTNESVHHVKDVLLSHGDVILRRWKASSPEFRTMVLNKASPIPFHHIHADARLGIPTIIPWLDCAALSQDSMKLLSLLHVRSQHGPERWAVFDTRSTNRVCRKSCCTPRWSYNAGAVIMYGERYGELVDFDVRSAHSWQQIGFPRALNTLLAQKTLALMLSAVVDILTRAAGPSGNSKWVKLVSRKLRSANEEVLWSSYYHQEFATPAKFDPEIILEKTRNQLNNLVDGIELLQTDPENMRQHVLETKAHTYFGKSTDQAWTKVARVIVCGRIMSLTAWRGIVAESENLKKVLGGLAFLRSQERG